MENEELFNSIQPKFLELSQPGQIKCKEFPQKDSGKQKNRKLLNFRNANWNLKVPEIPGGESNGTEIPGKKFSKIWIYFGRLYLFLKYREMLHYLYRKFLEFKPWFLVELRSLLVDHFRKIAHLAWAIWAS